MPETVKSRQGRQSLPGCFYRPWQNEGPHSSCEFWGASDQWGYPDSRSKTLKSRASISGWVAGAGLSGAKEAPGFHSCVAPTPATRKTKADEAPIHPASSEGCVRSLKEGSGTAILTRRCRLLPSSQWIHGWSCREADKPVRTPQVSLHLIR